MKLKKIYNYFLLPILAVFLIPSIKAYIQEDVIYYERQIIVAIVCGLIVGGVRCFWDVYQNRKIAD